MEKKPKAKFSADLYELNNLDLERPTDAALVQKIRLPVGDMDYYVEHQSKGQTDDYKSVSTSSKTTKKPAVRYVVDHVKYFHPQESSAFYKYIPEDSLKRHVNFSLISCVQLLVYLFDTIILNLPLL